MVYRNVQASGVVDLGMMILLYCQLNKLIVFYHPLQAHAVLDILYRLDLDDPANDMILQVQSRPGIRPCCNNIYFFT